MLFKVKDGNVELIKEVVEIVPSLKKLTEKQLKFIIIAFDYRYSPYRLKPEEFRISIAEKITGIKKKDIPNDLIEEYISCIYDLKRDKKNLYQKKLLITQSQFEAETSMIRLKDLSSLIDFLEKKISEIDNEIYREEESEIHLKGKKNLSYLEFMIRNRKLYNIDKESRESIKDTL